MSQHYRSTLFLSFPSLSFQDHLRLSCNYITLLSKYILQCMSPKKQALLINNHNIMARLGKITINAILLSEIESQFGEIFFQKIKYCFLKNEIG